MKNWSYKNYLVHHFAKLDSTNQVAFEMAGLKQIFDREIILADWQNAGRGRMDRTWSSPQGNLYFSLVLQPQGFVVDVAQISFVAILALRLAVEALVLGGKNPENAPMVENKWPNDLLLNGKKVAGLLLESKFNQQNCEFIVLGIGVNIGSNPENTIFPAGNLKDCAIEISPRDLLCKFLDQFEILYQNWLSFGFAGVRKLWLAKAFNLKKEILVSDGEAKISGIFEDLDSEGRLILLTREGVKVIAAADVFDFVR